MEKVSNDHSTRKVTTPNEPKEPQEFLGTSNTLRNIRIVFLLIVSILVSISYREFLDVQSAIYDNNSIGDNDAFQPPPLRQKPKRKIADGPATRTKKPARKKTKHTNTAANKKLDTAPATNKKQSRTKTQDNPGSEQTTDEEEDANTAKRRPMNVVVFFPDDMSHKSLQDVSGTDYVITPFLTALAKDGIRFTKNAVTTSVCWMSRATLFTGQYASSHGATRLSCPRFTLPEYWKDTWVAILQRVGGYYVGHVGKWQYNNGKGLARLFNFSSFFEGRHWHGETSNCDLAYQEVTEFLEKRPKDLPFALTVAFYPPKAVGSSSEPGGQWSPKESSKELYANKTYVPPYDVEKAFNRLPHFLKRGIVKTRYESRWDTTEKYNVGMRYYHALVTEVDTACRQIVDLLKDQGLYENTLIIFTSDNGLLMGSHGLGGKWIAYEDSIRVPLIIYDPRMPAEKRGSLDDSMTLNVDLASTILGAANIDPPPLMEGRDMADLYLQQRAKTPVEKVPWRTDFVYEYPNFDIHESYALIGKRYKYIDWVTRDYEQLFDLIKDPYELNDLLHNRTTKHRAQELLGELKNRYKEIRQESISPFADGPDWCNLTLEYP